MNFVKKSEICQKVSGFDPPPLMGRPGQEIPLPEGDYSDSSPKKSGWGRGGKRGGGGGGAPAKPPPSRSGGVVRGRALGEAKFWQDYFEAK